jgi:hypothetical protein
MEFIIPADIADVAKTANFHFDFLKELGLAKSPTPLMFYLSKTFPQYNVELCRNSKR